MVKSHDLESLHDRIVDVHGCPIHLVCGRGLSDPHGVIVGVDCVQEPEMQYVICTEYTRHTENMFTMKSTMRPLASFPERSLVWE